MLSGLLLVYIATVVFTPVEQGVFYTFLSLGAAQFFFDLGTGFVLANIAGREAPNFVGGSPIPAKELDALRQVVGFAWRWSAVAGLSLIVALGLVGTYVFRDQQSDSPQLIYVWMAYVSLVALSMCAQLFLRMFEGLGFVTQAASCRSVQSLVNVLCLYVLASNEFGIASVPMAMAIAVFSSTLYFYLSCKELRVAFSKGDSTTSSINWRRDILPFQSRVAVSWLAGYVIFQGQTPFLYKLAGPVEAGRFGMAVQIFLALTTSANIFLTLNIKTWTKHAANEEWSKLNRSFFRTTGATLLLIVFGCAAVLSAASYLTSHQFEIATRLPEFKILILFAIATSSNQVFFCLGYYFRARAEEPLWWISLIGAICILAVPTVMGIGFTALAAAVSFSVVALLLFGVLAPAYSYRLVATNILGTSPAVAR